MISIDRLLIDYKHQQGMDQSQKMRSFFKQQKSLASIDEKQEKKEVESKDLDLDQIGKEMKNIKFVEEMKDLRDPVMGETVDSQYGQVKTRSKSKEGKYKNYKRMNDSERELEYLQMRDELYDNKMRTQHITRLLDNVEGQLKALNDQDHKNTIQRHDKGKEKYRLEQENEKLRKKIYAYKNMKEIEGIVKKDKKKLVKGVSDMKVKSDTRDLVKLIDKLQQRLKQSEQSYKLLYQKMGNQKSQFEQQNHLYQNIDTMEKKQKTLYEYIEGQKMQLKNNTDRIQDLLLQIKDQRDENQRIQMNLNTLEIEKGEKMMLKKQIDEEKNNKRKLEMHLQRLLESPFVKEHQECVRNKEEMQELQVMVEQFEQEVKDQVEQIGETDLKIKNIEYQISKSNEQIKINRTELNSKMDDLKKQNNEYSQFKQYDIYTAKFEDIKKQLLLKNSNRGELLKSQDISDIQGKSIDIRKVKFMGAYEEDDDSIQGLGKKVERLKLEKGELAAQLEKADTQLTLQINIQHEQINVNNTESNLLQSQLKEIEVRIEDLVNKIKYFDDKPVVQSRHQFERQGIKYDDSVSVFSQQTQVEDYEGGLNCLDIYLDNIQYYDIEDAKNNLRFITLDFYDHKTQYSNMISDQSVKLQVSFKVNLDDQLLEFLANDSLNLEMYQYNNVSSQKIAYGNIKLDQIIKKNTQPNISAVINDSIALYRYSSEKKLNDQIMAQLKFKMKMRLPISESVQWMYQKIKMQLGYDPSQQTGEFNYIRQKKLYFKITEGSYTQNVKANDKTFVYFVIDNRDYSSGLEQGRNPRYEYNRNIDIFYNQQFERFLKSQQLEIFVINDSSIDDDNLVGTAKISLKELVNNVQIVDNSIDLMKNGTNVGALKCSFYWQMTKTHTIDTQQDTMLTQNWDQEVTMRIADAFINKNLNLVSAFKLVANTTENIIEYNKFVTSMYLMDLKMSEQDLQFFYNRRQKPFDEMQFRKIFSPYIQVGYTNQYSQKQQHQIMNIKKILQQQLQIFSKQEIKQKLDYNGDGYISNLELKSFLQQNKVSLTTEEIKLFLEFIDQDGNNQIDIEELLILINCDDKEMHQLFQNQNKGMGIKMLSQGIDDEVRIIYDRLKLFAFQNKIQDLSKLYNMVNVRQKKYITFLEIQEFIKVKLNLQVNNIMKFVDYFKKTKDDRIHEQEFSNMMRQLEITFQGERVGTKQNENKKDSIQIFYEGLKSYVRKNKIESKLKLYKILDKNGDGSISYKEFINFLDNTLGISVENPKMVFNSFDQSGDGSVSINEFIKILEKGSQNFYVSLFEGVHSNIDKIIQYVQRNLTLQEANLGLMFKDIEKFSNDYISQQDIQLVLQKINVMLDISEIDELVYHLSKTKDGLITVRDFMTIQNIQSNLKRLSLEDKLEIIISKHGSKMKANYQSEISYEQFQLIFQNLPLKEEEVITTEELLELKKKYQKSVDGKIDYHLFLAKYDNKNLKARKFFGDLGKVLKKKKIDFKKVFQSFDQNNDNYITDEEMVRIFYKIGITEFSEQQIKNMYANLDEDKNGRLSMEEFLQALNG